MVAGDAVFICGIAGAWLAVRTSALGVGEWIGLASAERSPQWRTYAAILLDTRYGTAWLAYAACLALAMLPQAGMLVRLRKKFAR